MTGKRKPHARRLQNNRCFIVEWFNRATREGGKRLGAKVFMPESV